MQSQLSSGGLPHTIVTGVRFEPEWLRVRTGGCVVVDNRTNTSYETPQGTVDANGPSTLCFDQPGIYRIRLGSRPYSGGFVYVDANGGP